MKTGHLIALTAACAVVLFGSLMSWVTFKAQLPLGINGEQAELLRQAMDAVREELTINGWSGHLTLFGLTLPNWLVPVTAIAATGTAWARATDTWDTSPKVSVVLSAYGVAHLGILVVVLLANPGQTNIGLGTVVSLLGALGALVFSVLGVLSGNQSETATTTRRAAFSAPGSTAGYPSPREAIPGYPAPHQPIGSYPAPLSHAGDESETTRPTTLGRVQPTMDD